MAGRPSPDPDFLLRGNRSPITCIVHTKDGVLSGTQDGEILQWDLRTRRIKNKTQAHSGGVVALIVWNDHVFSQGRDGCIKQWNSDWEAKGIIMGSTHAFCSAVHMYKDIVAMPTDDQSNVALVSLETKQISRTLAPKTSSEKGYGMCMCLKSLWRETSATKALLLTGYENGRIVLWNTELGTEIDSLAEHTEAVMCMDYSEILQRGISGSVDEQLLVWNITQDDKLAVFTRIQITNPGINCVRFRDDGKIVLTGGWDGQVRIYSGKTLRPLAVLTCHKESVSCVSFSKEQSFLAGSKDGAISSWSVYKNK